MILSWAIYALLVSLALGWAAAASERVLRLYDVQARAVWIGAMALSVSLPAAAFLAPSLTGAGEAGGLPPAWSVPALPVLIGTVQGAAEAGRSNYPWLEDAFLAAWVAASAGIALWLAASVKSVRRRERGWEPLPSLDGPVFRDEDFGPAAVGLVSPRIVVPGWVMELDEGPRRMVVLHEREHARAGDPALVAAGWTLVVLAPWVAPLWWQFRRLRQAVEMDCDLRVVRRTRDRREYGRVLLEACRRSGRRAAPLVAGGESFLGDRIRSLVDGKPPFRALRAVSGLTALICAALLAATLPSPRTASAWTGPAAFNRTLQGDPWASRVDPAIVNEDEVLRSIQAEYPDELRASGVGGTVNVVVHVRPDGRVMETLLQRSSGRPSLDRAAREVARGIRFEARAGPEPSEGYWLIQPIRFRVR